MRLKIILKLVASTALLSGCNSVPEPPNVDLCAMISGTDTLYCESYFHEGEGYELTSSQAFDRKYFAISPKDFNLIKNYTQRLERLAKQRCE